MNKLNSLDIQFEAEPHRYSLPRNPSLQFGSCTEFIKQFFAPFDSFKIATNLVNNHPKYSGHTVAGLIAEWKAAADAGTRTHEDMENYILEATPALTAKGKAGIVWFENYRRSRPNHVFTPEQIVYSEQLGLAGMVDLLVYNPGDDSYGIVDWKTSKRIDISAFGGKTGIHPVSSSLADCNFVHYSLQMTLYRYLLEEFYGLNIRSQSILHLRDDGVEEIECPYMRENLLEMLNATIGRVDAA